MSQSVSLPFRIPPAKAAALDELAEATDRPRSWLLEQALDAYLEAQAWQVGHIRQGLAEIDRGEVVDHEAVADWLSTWGTPGERAAPR